ncbi:MAG TPA: hypothetical protein VG476_14505 [Acidimicrobiales bacterium]|nr:hypothetical protein [Acidimicrobiales bacterium]
MTQRKSLLEQALDVCLYAPVGLAIAVTEELPQLIDKGRARVNSQLTMAKMVGSFAVAQGQREAERVVRQATGQTSAGAPGVPPSAPGAGGVEEAQWATPATEPARDGDGVTTASSPDGAGPTSTTDGGHDHAGAVASPVPSQPAPGEDVPVPPTAMPAGGAGALAIPGYDALSASQVVQRLAGLAPDELEAVRTYEAATRRRRTILNRIAQLQAPGTS